jgi:UDP-N-acetylmuramoyl-tripeptide--D-alanyl-D-alanine ligase
VLETVSTSIVAGYSGLIQSAPALVAIANAICGRMNSKQQAFLQKLKTSSPTINTVGLLVYGKLVPKPSRMVFSEAIEPARTPGSINTEMGVTRQNSGENLKPQQRLAIIEMGPIKSGSIHKVCRFTYTECRIGHCCRRDAPRTLLVVLENIYKAKCELAQAIPADGCLSVMGTILARGKWLQRYPKATTLLCG